jgi:hypothetical protein
LVAALLRSIKGLLGETKNKPDARRRWLPIEDVRPDAGSDGRVRATVVALVAAMPVSFKDTWRRLASSGLFGPRATNVPPHWRGHSFDLACILGIQSARLSILALDGFVHLLAVYGDLDWGRDTQSNLIAPNIHHGDDDVIAYDDTFVAVSGQDQHRSRLLPPANEARDHPRSRCPGSR